MASYQMRQRDPLFDSSTQAALERRGKELIGVLLVVVGVLIGMMIGSYHADDPSWMSATDEPAQNLLGRTGASIASPLIVIAGYGAWALSIAFVVWGLRFITHRGEDRAINRSVFVPIAAALVSVYASTLVPSHDWGHSFGLGGLFGDTILGALLGVAPLSAGLGLKMMSLLSFIAAVAFGLYVLGFDRAELRGLSRFLARGLVTGYDRLMNGAGRGANGAFRVAQSAAQSAVQTAAEKRREKREAALAAPSSRVTRQAEPQDAWSAPQPMVAAATLRAEPRYEEEQPPRERPGLLARAFVKRAPEPEPEPELVEPLLSRHLPEDLPDSDRVRARITSVVRARASRSGSPRLEPPIVAGARSEPPLVRARRPMPLIANTRPRPPLPPVAAPALSEALGEDEQLPLDLADEFDDLEMCEDVMPEPVMPPVMPPAAPPSPAPRRSDPVEMADEDEEEDTTRNIFALEDERAPQEAFDARRIKVQHGSRRTAQATTAQVATAPRRPPVPSYPDYEHPPLALLMDPAEISRHVLPDEALEENARTLESVLDDYGVKGEIVSVRPGPVVTMYELEPAPGLKASRVIGLADDIARSMSALSARVSTVPGRSVIGIELPNEKREKVVLREILTSRDFGDTAMRLPLALGKDIGGAAVVANLAKMPHLLIAGTTGSGKSVAINTMILSLLYRLSPEECRLIMIDPKMLELSVYDGIPHLLSPVVTDPKKAVVALKWVVGEMEERYRKMSKMGVRNIEGYNGRVHEAQAKGEMFKRTVQTGFDEETGDPIFETEEIEPKTIPFIVVIVDEMADLMMVAGKEIEACIQRLAQMARASGIHLIMATQRPSVDVITGTIKANFPTRISFQVTSKIDSRTILGEQGAEQLLGQGDMLYMAGGSKITRVHGPFVSDEEVEEIVNHLKSFGPPEYMSGVVEGPDDERADDIDAVLGLGGNTDGEDSLYDQAVAIVAKDRKCSTSYIQRKLGIGYNKAAKLVEQMEDEGVVSSANHVGKREVLVPEP